MFSLLIATVKSKFGNIHKIWKNYGVYGYSRLLSVIVQILLKIFLKVLQTFHLILDLIPCINNNDKCLSPELRSIHSALIIIKFLIPIKKTWPLLNNCLFSFDYIYLTVFNRLVDFGVGALVTIPKYTNIRNKTLHKTNFIITCLDKLKEKYVIPIKLHNNNNYKCFCPRNVDYVWISATDEIEQNDIRNKLIIFLHGGGYTLGGPSHIGFASRLSLHSNTKILFIQYGKPPKADIPYQVDQVMTMYFYLLSYYKMNPKRIVIIGDSAGGGLCTLFLQKLSLLNLSCIHPLGMILFSPWVDLAMENNSWVQCQYHDLIVCNTYTSRSALIAVGNDENNLRSPFFSAIYCPTHKVDCNVMIFVSKHECLYDDSQKLVEKLRNNNIFNEEGSKELIYHQVDYMPHAFVIFHSVFPEANDAMDKVCQTLSKWFSRT